MMTYGTTMMFFCITFVYYGISFTMDSIGLNIYLNSLIIGSAETLAYIMINSVIVKVKRKQVSVICFVISCILSCSFIFMENKVEECGENNICPISIL
jgi:Na+/melibiose symporter-like transporter